MVRAKFRCMKVARTESGIEVEMMPVTSGGKENEEFFKWTPYGEIKMGIVNPNVATSFEPGKEYYVDFTEV